MIETAVISRKDQIKQVAQNMFRARGYAATSMRDLAKAVGVEPASLYNHIKSKEDILNDICFTMADEFFETADRADLMGAADVRLHKAIKGHVNVIINNIDASHVFFNEWRFLSEPDLGKFKSLRINYEWKFKQILQDGVKQGIFKDINIKLTVFTIFSALNATYDLYNATESLTEEQIAQEIGNIIINGIKV